MTVTGTTTKLAVPLLLAASLLLSVHARAEERQPAATTEVSEEDDATATPPTPYYTPSNKEGYYWKTPDPPKEEKKKKKKKKPEEPKQPEDQPKKHRIPSLKNYTVKELWNMHPDDFQALLMDFQKKAVQTPTEANVREYLTMQDLAVRKAQAYTSVASLVQQKSPELNMEREFQGSTPGRKANFLTTFYEEKTLLQKERENFGIIYFYSEKDRASKAEEPLVAGVARNVGWDVKKVSLELEPDVFRTFNISTVPTIVLVSRARMESLPVAYGVVAQDDLSHRLYRGVRLLKGDVSPEQYDMHDFEKNGPFDPLAPLRGTQPADTLGQEQEAGEESQ